MKKGEYDHLRCTSKLGWGFGPMYLKTTRFLKMIKLQRFNGGRYLAAAAFFLLPFPLSLLSIGFLRSKPMGVAVLNTWRTSSIMLGLPLSAKHKLNPKINLFRLSKFYRFNQLYVIDVCTCHHGQNVIHDRRIYASQLQLSFITAEGY